MKPTLAFILATSTIVVLYMSTTAGAGHVVVADTPRACGGGCVTSNQCAAWDNGNRDCRCSWFTCGLVHSGEAEETRLELFEQFLKDYKNQPVMILAVQEALRTKMSA